MAKKENIRLKKNNKTSFKDKLVSFEIVFNEWLRKSITKFQAFVIIAASLIITWLTLPDSIMTKLPIENESIGETMEFTARSDRDYSIVDDDATQKERVKAQNNVPLYFSYIDSSLYYKNISQAFASQRELILSFIKANFTQNVDEKLKDIYAGAMFRAMTAGNFRKEKESVVKYISQYRQSFEKISGVPINENIYNAVSEVLFSKKIEQALYSLLTKLDSYYIYRTGINNDYTLSTIVIEKGDAFLEIGTEKLISLNTFLYEIKHHQKKLHQDRLLNEEGRKLVRSIAYWFIKDNIYIDTSLTEKKKMEAWNSVQDTIFSVKRGEIIRRAGEKINARDIKIFKQIKQQSAQASFLFLFIRNFLLLTLIQVILFLVFVKNIKKFSYRNKDIILIYSQLIIFFLLYDITQTLSIPFSEWIGNIDARIFFFLIPVPFLVAATRLLINTETSIFFVISFITSLFTIFPDSIIFPIYFAVSSLFFVSRVTHIEHRSTIVREGFLLALTQSVIALFIFALDFTISLDNIPRALSFTCTSGFLSGILLIGFISIWEWLLNYTTDITFLEYSNLNHPLMKQMAVQANGTYQHSLTVGALVEEAAIQIGLNPLACKAMAYFHDIGKIERPEYFSENQTGINRHDELKPNMSAVVIINHVKQGIELARKHHLGEKIENAIREHQGDALIKYFYAKAKSEAKEGDPSVDESFFRYPGPRPGSRETGLIMLADSVEAAIRSMPEKNFQKISDGVENIVNRIIQDSQLSECNMTMKDISAIKASFVKTLSGIYHARIEYPQPVA